MTKALLGIFLAVALLSRTTDAHVAYELGDHLCLTPVNPIVDHVHHFTLDQIIDMIILDTDTDRNRNITIDEVRYELLSRWTGSSTSINRADFINIISTRYWEDTYVAGQFFDCLDVAYPPGVLDENDFLMTMMGSGFLLDSRVDLNEFRLFLHQYHPNGCANSQCKKS